MRLLFIHNRYRLSGGEDAVFEAERKLLRKRGHKVITFIEENTRLTQVHLLKAAIEVVWSRQIEKCLYKIVQEVQPNIAHFHNIFLRISPSAYYACKKAGIPVIQSLHNYRLVCPGPYLLRKGRVCEACLGKLIPWPGVVHGCWRGQIPTTVVAAMLVVHRLLKTWIQQVDLYIALSEFARRKFIQGGLPAEKIVVKPNFVHPDPGMGNHDGKYALFVGRLSPEKGLHTLLQAWKYLHDIPLHIVGEGPLWDEIASFIQEAKLSSVQLLGRRPRHEVMALMKEARFLVFPSVWYESFPMTLIEAFATGLPVVASRLGAMAEIVEHGRTGLLFEPGNPEALAEAVAWAWSHPRQMAEMGREARQEYEAKYTAERNYEMLMDIYQKAMAMAR